MVRPLREAVSTKVRGYVSPSSRVNNKGGSMVNRAKVKNEGRKSRQKEERGRAGDPKATRRARVKSGR
jgi:hypothetical protein